MSDAIRATERALRRTIRLTDATHVSKRSEYDRNPYRWIGFKGHGPIHRRRNQLLKRHRRLTGIVRNGEFTNLYDNLRRWDLI